MLGCKELKKESAAWVEQTFELFPCIICVNSTHCLQSIKLDTKSIKKIQVSSIYFRFGSAKREVNWSKLPALLIKY